MRLRLPALVHLLLLLTLVCGCTLREAPETPYEGRGGLGGGDGDAHMGGNSGGGTGANPGSDAGFPQDSGPGGGEGLDAGWDAFAPEDATGGGDMDSGWMSDTGPELDAGTPPDGGTSTDVGTPSDSGADASPPDANPPGDTGTDTGSDTGSDTGTGTDAGPPPGPLLDLPQMPYSYSDVLPLHFQSPRVLGNDNTPLDNPITDNGATLGRVLFYDRDLSENRTISCASCHGQATGFTDTNQFSVGFRGGRTSRHSMPLTEARFARQGRFFWDTRAASLEAQVLAPFQDPVEMGLTLDTLVERVRQRPYAERLFTLAFGNATVTSDRIAKALAQYIRAHVSYRSRYDQGRARVSDITDTFPSFTDEENRGKTLFLGRGGCANCHLDQGGPPPTDGTLRPNQANFLIDVPANNGLDDTFMVADNGVGGRTGLEGDKGLFRSPSLRNVALTAPYMHDGRIATLEGVINHYSTGVKAHPNLDRRLRGMDGAPRRLNLTNDEKAALIAFLNTLTDEAMLQDVRFSDPFRR